MSRLTNYLKEERSELVSRDIAISFLTKNNNWKTGSIIYRGLETSNDIVFIQPSKHTRESANVEYNYYTLLFDNLPNWKQYPKRSKSIVCSTSYNTSSNYGRIYRVFLKNGSKIGVCPEDDIWHSFDEFDPLSDFNYMLHNLFENGNNMPSKDPYNWDQLLRNFAWIDRFKIDVMEDVENMHDEDYPDEPPLSKEDILDRSISLIEDIDSDYLGVYSIKYKNFLPNFFKYNGDFVDYIGEKLDPKRNDFKLVKAGMKISNDNAEVWSDGDAILIADELADEIIKSIS